jgi:predicted dehydrogenase
VEGTGGSLFFDDADLTVHLLRPGKKPEIFRTGDWLDRETGENLALRDQAKEVLNAFAMDRHPQVALEDGLQAALAANAIYRSAVSGRPVSLK